MHKSVSIPVNNTGTAIPDWSKLSPSLWLRKPLVYHSAFWLLLYLFYTFYIGYLVGNYEYSFYSFTVRLPLLVLFCYFNLYVLLPRFLMQKQYGVYFGGLSLSMLAAAYLTQLLFDRLIHFDYCPSSFEAKSAMNTSNTIEKLVLLLTTTGLTTGIKLAKDWINHQQKAKQVEQQNLRNELSFLKSQLQPHFFFNTLNNLYALTLKKSDEAPETVVKLSDLMSYMLYECDVPQISLAKEIGHLQNYLDLEALRFGKRLTLDFDVNGDIHPHTIPPLLLLPFIENSFKHGTANQLRHIHITMKLEVSHNHLTFQVQNPQPDTAFMPEKQKAQGLGLKNVKRRLELLYGNNYILEIYSATNIYRVMLQIPLL